jgi:prevent-host-death family protein
MRSIGVRELRQSASAVLRDVERGVTFEVTDHGRPVALLTPLPPDAVVASPLERLRAAGEIEPSRGRLADLPPPLELPKGRAAPSVVLARLRAHER